MIVKRSGGSNCGDIWVDGDSVFGAFAAAGAAFAFLAYQSITMAARRRKRDLNKDQDILGTMLQLGK